MSSPTPQFKSNNSSALSFLYGPTLISTHYYWKNHSLDWTDLLVMSLLFKMLSRLFKEQQTGSKYRKEYVKAVYCHRAYLTYMQSTS